MRERESDREGERESDREGEREKNRTKFQLKKDAITTKILAKEELRM